MAWVLLCVAGLFETAWAVALKYSDGFSRLVPSILAVSAMTASIVCLAFALKSLPVGTGYAVWTGIGAVGTAILGIYLFQEPATSLRLGSIALVVAGIVGLKLAS
jgi:quaternary ammonium compound-resistance protein SugE